MRQTSDSTQGPDSELAPGFLAIAAPSKSTDATLKNCHSSIDHAPASAPTSAFGSSEGEDGVARRPFLMAAKTNLLYDLALVPNIGAEVHLGRGWTLNVSGMYGWWSKKPDHYYWHFSGGEIGLRKYFGRRAAQSPLTGHHLGLYGQHMTWGFEFGKTGYLSYFSQGAGLEYGFSFPLAERLNLDLSLGAGYFGGDYLIYEPDAGYYVWQRTVKLAWFGPTKAEVSLVWLIGKGWTRTSRPAPRGSRAARRASAQPVALAGASGINLVEASAHPASPKLGKGKASTKTNSDRGRGGAR